MSFLNSKVLWQSLTILRHTKMQPTQKARSCVTSQISKPNKMTFPKIFEKKNLKIFDQEKKKFKKWKNRAFKANWFLKRWRRWDPPFFSAASIFVPCLKFRHFDSDLFFFLCSQIILNQNFESFLLLGQSCHGEQLKFSSLWLDLLQQLQGTALFGSYFSYSLRSLIVR